MKLFLGIVCERKDLLILAFGIITMALIAYGPSSSDRRKRRKIQRRVDEGAAMRSFLKAMNDILDISQRLIKAHVGNHDEPTQHLIFNLRDELHENILIMKLGYELDNIALFKRLDQHPSIVKWINLSYNMVLFLVYRFNKLGGKSVALDPTGPSYEAVTMSLLAGLNIDVGDSLEDDLDFILALSAILVALNDGYPPKGTIGIEEVADKVKDW